MSTGTDTVVQQIYVDVDATIDIQPCECCQHEYTEHGDTICWVSECPCERWRGYLRVLS